MNPIVLDLGEPCCGTGDTMAAAASRRKRKAALALKEGRKNPPEKNNPNPTLLPVKPVQADKFFV